jgi:hypothetical protein
MYIECPQDRTLALYHGAVSTLVMQVQPILCIQLPQQYSQVLATRYNPIDDYELIDFYQIVHGQHLIEGQ